MKGKHSDIYILLVYGKGAKKIQKKSIICSAYSAQTITHAHVKSEPQHLPHTLCKK